MEQVRVGVGVIIFDGNKILLGHRCAKRSDTGGIIGNDTWTLPGGKQEYNETIQECAIREVKEECNLDITDTVVITANDDIAPDRHYVTITVMTSKYSGELKIVEPLKEDDWKWFDLDNLPDNIYGPSQKSIKYYKDNVWQK